MPAKQQPPARPDQKPYTLPDGTALAVDAAIPDAVLGRLNRLPFLRCESTCSGGHRSWILVNGAERPAPKPRGPRDRLPAAILGRHAKAGFRFTEPGTWVLPRAVDVTRRVYSDGAYFWIVAATESVAPPDWWDEVCRIVEEVTR